MKAKKNDKTNVMEYESHTYEANPTMTGVEIAGILGEEVERVFKTLVTRARPGLTMYL